MSTTSVTPSTFTGSSAFSSDLQTALSKALSFASLPMQQLQNEQGTITSQQAELQTLGSQFQSLQSALDALNTSAGLSSYAASVSNQSVATADISSGISSGSYAINVVNIGSQTTTMSANGLTVVTDPSSGNIDQSSNYTLTVNSQTYQISNSGNTLDSLAQAINASNANVQATVVNVGNATSPDYRLSIQSSEYAPDSIQLSDGTQSLLSTLTTGSYVEYQVNGQPATPIESTSRNVTISPGLSLNLVAAGSANITVTQNATGAANALSSFAAAYNTVVDELVKSRGQNGGALAGESIVYDLQNSLNTLASYTGSSGSLSSLSDLGLTFDQNGHLQFDQSVFNQLGTTDVLNFLGSESSGGFLQSAENILTAVTDPTTGLLTQSTQSMANEISSLGNQIQADQDKVNLLQQSLTAQMSQADATISSLEQQVSYFTDLFSTMRANETSG